MSFEPLNILNVLKSCFSYGFKFSLLGMPKKLIKYTNFAAQITSLKYFPNEIAFQLEKWNSHSCTFVERSE